MGWRGRRPDRPGVIRRTGRWSAGLRAGPGPARGRPDPARPTRRGRRRPGLGRGAPSVAPVWPGVLPAAVAGSPAIAFRTVATLAARAAAACGCPAGVLACGAGAGRRAPAGPAGCPAVAPGWRPADASGSTVARALNGRAASGYCASSERIARAVRPSVVGAEAVVSLLVTRPRAARASAAAVLASTMAARSPRAPPVWTPWRGSRGEPSAWPGFSRLPGWLTASGRAPET